MQNSQEYQHRYYLAHREKILASAKKWYLLNRKKALKYAAQWRKKNIKKRRAYFKVYQQLERVKSKQHFYKKEWDRKWRPTIEQLAHRL